MSSSESLSTPLSAWNEKIEEFLFSGRPQEAIIAAKVVLKRLPQHLPTYVRLLGAMWMLRRWEEGRDWGARLLRADPGSAPGWRALAMAAEQRGERAEARSIWQRAFESDPYEPEIRAGLSRTSLEQADPLELNHACLATLYLLGHRWRRAVYAYMPLVDANPQRNDFRLCQLVALWQADARSEAYRLAQQIVARDRSLLVPWIVLNELGDKNDRALALHPLNSMDPDGEYVRDWLGLDLSRAPIMLEVSRAEIAMISAS